MNKTTIIIYAIIVGVAILSSILKKRKKSETTTNTGPKKIITNPDSYRDNQPTTSAYKKPPATQPKSLEDILQNLLGGQQRVKTFAPEAEEEMVFPDKQPQKYTTLEGPESLEKQKVEYYNYNTELEYKDEMVDYDKTTDHHVHGLGFDEIKEEVVVEVESEWANIDWRKAVITAEILKRPEY